MRNRETTRTLTDLAVKKIKPPAAGRAEHWDAALPGFGLRVSSSGVKSWVLMTRVNGRQKRITLGRYPGLRLDKARELARDNLYQASKGVDPTEEKRSRKAEAAAAAKAKQETGYLPGSFGDVAERYIKRETPRLRRGWEVERIIRRELLGEKNADWSDRPIDGLRKRDAIQATNALLDEGKPQAANLLARYIKRIFNWAVEQDELENSPFASMKPPAALVSRDRVLTDGEVKAIWEGANDMGWRFGPFIQLLVVTGQRRNEVAGMRWTDLKDLDTPEKALWTIPRERAKSDRAHDVPLSPLAVEILDALPRSKSDFVFPATSGEGHISGYSKVKRRLDEKTEVTNWRLHDFRRTMATGMARLGVAELVLAKVLNHSARAVAGITAVYDRHTYLDEKRHALNAWARKLESIVRPGDDKVVPLRG